MSATGAGYRSYWIAWLVLLILTVAMLAVGNPTLLLGLVMVKASIIALWFMHLRQERFDVSMAVLIGIVGTGVLLFVVIAPDGKAM